MQKPDFAHWPNAADAPAQTDAAAVKRALQTGNVNELAGALGRDDLQKVQAVLNDPEQLRRVLDSPLAKQVAKRFGR